MKPIFTGLQVLGAGLIVFGVALINTTFAIVLAGSFCLLFGIALERGESRDAR